MSEEIEESNDSEEVVCEYLYTSNGEAINIAYTAICSVDGLDRFQDEEWKERKEKIISKSLDIIERIIDDLHDEMFAE